MPGRHGAAPAAGLHLNAGARWETDATLRQALQSYGRYFEHPGWRPATD